MVDGAQDTAEPPCTEDQKTPAKVPVTEATDNRLASSILNIWIIVNDDEDTRHHIRDFKISATVLQFASEPFRRAFDSKVPEEHRDKKFISDPSGCHWVETKAPSVVVFRETGKSFGLGLRISRSNFSHACQWNDEIINAIQVVLDILHMKAEYNCSLKPWELALVAEIAFALDCVTQILPWLNMWLPLVVKAHEGYRDWIGERGWGSAHGYVRGIVSFVMGDAMCFRGACSTWAWEWDMSVDDARWSLVVFPFIKGMFPTPQITPQISMIISNTT